MNVNRPWMGALLVSLGFMAVVGAIDIPLTGVDGSGGGQKIGYIDMERIFQVYPQTKHAKEDYAERLQKKREALAEKEAELRELKSRISVLETSYQDLQDQPDLNNNPDRLVQMKVELESKRQELEEQKKQAIDEMAAFEKQQSQIILGKIYQALKELAIEEQVSLVVDKSSILFGSAEVDLTEKLQQRVRGF